MFFKKKINNYLFQRKYVLHLHPQSRNKRGCKSLEALLGLTYILKNGEVAQLVRAHDS